mmetsp:Transcript_53545/g.148867  ORF Transcript_53545/g.148867 Transcript_53545/m.148867 type:complete len:527 (-) Transcript_53545:74-1654(-)
MASTYEPFAQPLLQGKEDFDALVGALWNALETSEHARKAERAECGEDVDSYASSHGEHGRSEHAPAVDSVSYKASRGERNRSKRGYGEGSSSVHGALDGELGKPEHATLGGESGRSQAAPHGEHRQPYHCDGGASSSSCGALHTEHGECCRQCFVKEEEFLRSHLADDIHEQHRALETAFNHSLERMKALRATGAHAGDRGEAAALKVVLQGIAQELQRHRGIVAEWRARAFCHVAPYGLQCLELAEVVHVRCASRDLRRVTEVPDATGNSKRHRLAVTHLRRVAGQLGSNDASHLVDALNLSSLRSLEADLDGSEGCGWDAFLAALVSGQEQGRARATECTHLEVVRLSSSCGVVPATVVGGLRSFGALRELELKGVSPDAPVVLDLQTLAESLTWLEDLEVLSLVDITPADSGQDTMCFFWSLGFYVQHAESLHTLRLVGWSESPRKELVELLKRVPFAPQLRTLDLLRCGLGDASVEALCLGLGENRTLRMLRLEQCSCTREAEEMLSQMLEVNGTLEHVAFW